MSRLGEENKELLEQLQPMVQHSGSGDTNSQPSAPQNHLRKPPLSPRRAGNSRVQGQGVPSTQESSVSALAAAATEVSTANALAALRTEIAAMLGRRRSWLSCLVCVQAELARLGEEHDVLLELCGCLAASVLCSPIGRQKSLARMIELVDGQREMLDAAHLLQPLLRLVQQYQGPGKSNQETANEVGCQTAAAAYPSFCQVSKEDVNLRSTGGGSRRKRRGS